MKEKLKYWDDFLNPVLVKEIRQFFHNKLLLSLVAGLLGIQLLVLFIFNLTFSQWKEGDEAGVIFMGIETVLMYLCVFGVAVWGPMQRFTQERSSKELDFSNITLLSPWQIIGGKLASSLVIWALVAALCLPFMTIAYFFRNVTLYEIFLIFGAGVMPTLILIQAALFCGALGKKWIYALFIYFGFQIIVPMGILSIGAWLDGNGVILDVFWAIQGGGLLLFILLLAASVALITPPYANRMFPLRLLLSVMFLAALVLVPFSCGFKKELQLVFAAFPMGVICTYALLAACDREKPGGRVLAQVPRNGAGRFLHYLLSSNRTGGVVCTLSALLIFGVELLILSFWKNAGFAAMTFGIAGYFVLYAELAIMLNRHVPSIPGWGGMLIIFIALGVIPMVAAVNQDVHASEILISPFALLDIKSVRLSILNPVLWIAPVASWITGIFFIADMVSTYRFYKVPDLEKAKQNTVKE